MALVQGMPLKRPAASPARSLATSHAGMPCVVGGRCHIGLHRPWLLPSQRWLLVSVHTPEVAVVEEDVGSKQLVDSVVAAAAVEALGLASAGNGTVATGSSKLPATSQQRNLGEGSNTDGRPAAAEESFLGSLVVVPQFAETVQGANASASTAPSVANGQQSGVQQANGSAAAAIAQSQVGQSVTGASGVEADVASSLAEVLNDTDSGSSSATSSMDDQDDVRKAVVPEPEHPPVQATPTIGIKIKEAAICAGIGLAIRFLVPIPTGVTPQAWTLLSVFCSTIAGLILEPMPVSAWSLTMLTTLLVTKATTFQVAMSGLTNEAIWLITFAFFFAKAFEKTGLGERVANMFVSAVGHSTLGVAYSLALAETLMAPAMPSCTARAGGIFMPVIKFLAKSSGSEPRSGRRKMGAFLVHSQMQVSSNIAALFMTGAAQNLLAINIARSMGVVIPDVWATWALGACLPGIISVVTIPLVIYYLMPPELRSTPSAPTEAKQRLQGMGALSRDEVITLVTLAGAVVLWMLGDQIGCSAVLGAMVALSSLLLTGVLAWRDCLDYTPAWDTLVWFSVLMSLCSALAGCGLVGRMADAVGGALAQAKLPWLASFGLLHAVFFWTHYVFASQVGHVGALYGAFLAMMLAAGVPTTLAVMTLGYSANLFGSLTHYASGPAAVFHGSGYTRLDEVMKVGALMGLRSWLVWGVVGMAWWRVLGWW